MKRGMDNCTVLEYLTTKDLCQIFDRTSMTIFNWRRQEELPYVLIKGNERNHIRYDLDEVLNWAEERNKKTHLPPTLHHNNQAT